MTQSNIERHLDWLEYKYVFMPTMDIRKILCPLYKNIIKESLEQNLLPQEIEDLFKNKILSKITL